MYCVIVGHNFINEVQTVSQIFFPNENFVLSDSISNEHYTLVSSLEETGVYKDGECVKICPNPIADGLFSDYVNEEKAKRNAVQKGVFALCMEIFPLFAPWGLQVGIRPTKIVSELLDIGKTQGEIKDFLVKFYLISEEKADLCVSVALAERRFLTKDDSISLYIGIPFCVSRCLYCSFSSYTTKQYAKQIDAYVDALILELTEVSPYIEKNLQTMYIGGGTPTALNERQLDRLLCAVTNLYKADAEFTVEAGRPDTITPEKLRILKRAGVNRVSINPQTLNDRTLEKIGRSHTKDDFFRAFFAAREEGFRVINADLIMGLMGETPADVLRTLDGVFALSPENVTVHTLTVKRASALKEQLDTIDLTHYAEIAKMLDAAREYAKNAEMFPYYMYRQKNILGNFENVGYCKEGFECIYNIQMIEDKQTIIAFGAGAATKKVDISKNLIERSYNLKTPHEYIARIDEMIDKKINFLR